MHLEVFVGAVAKELRAAWPEVGKPGDVLLGRRGGCLVEVDCGHVRAPCSMRSDLFSFIASSMEAMIVLIQTLQPTRRSAACVGARCSGGRNGARNLARHG